jgi:uncharacterized protein (DUF362 family)
LTNPRPKPGTDGRSQIPPQSRVALIHGSDRYGNVTQALESIAGDIDLSRRQRVLIKPNFVVTHNPLCSTHVDAVRAVLDFLRDRYQGPVVINLNLALLAPLVAPHLAVIDGFEAMEGNGPTDGTIVPLGLALVSTDALAADVVGTTIMGFDPDNVGYLHYCQRMQLGVGDLSCIEIVGNARLADCIRPFRPHDTYRRQRRWHLPGAERYLPSLDDKLQGGGAPERKREENP